MAEPIYNRPLRLLDYRLLFWIITHQTYKDGKPTGEIPHVRPSWRVQAQTELGTYRSKLWAAEKRLQQAGVIESPANQRTVKINPEAFE